jgi:dolichol-phosphate mannosyltransferase
MKTVTIVLPTHNEGESIRFTLNEISNSIENNMYEFKIFVAEDGSTDQTRNEVTKAISENMITTEISKPSARLGYSKAIQESIKNCKTDIFIFMDSDGQYDPKEVSFLLENLQPGFVVCGYRNPRKDPFKRILYSNLFKILFIFLFKIKLKDPSSPFIAANSDDIKFIENVNIKLNYGFWWEFQARINNAGLKIIEIPVKHRNRVVGQTQVYKIQKLPKIITTHVLGLYKLKKELNSLITT